MDKFLKPPSLNKVAEIASLCDLNGDYEDAEILDEYIEKSSEFSNDLMKQAGFWSNVWKRLKGRAKTLFIEEYKELHDAANEVQKSFDDRIDEINAIHKQIKDDFKNYDLADWRTKIQSLNYLNMADIVGPYDKVYARFLEYVGSFKEVKEEKEKAKLSPSEKFIIPTKKEEVKQEEEKGWVIQDKENAIFKTRDGEFVKVDVNQTKYIKNIVSIRGEPKEYRKINPETKLMVLHRVFGDDVWKEIKEDDKYIYYQYVGKISKPEKPMPISKPEEIFKAPKLPIEEKTKELLGLSKPPSASWFKYIGPEEKHKGEDVSAVYSYVDREEAAKNPDKYGPEEIDGDIIDYLDSTGEHTLVPLFKSEETPREARINKLLSLVKLGD